MEEIKEEYEEIRDEHYDSLKVREMSLGVTITPIKVAGLFFLLGIKPRCYVLNWLWFRRIRR